MVPSRNRRRGVSKTTHTLQSMETVCLLARGNSLTFGICQSAMNLATHSGNLALTAKFCGVLLDNFEAVCPANHPETANHHAWRCTVLKRILAGDGRCASIPKKLEQEYRGLIQTSRKRCLEIRKVCFGEEHPLVSESELI